MLFKEPRKRKREPSQISLSEAKREARATRDKLAFDLHGQGLSYQNIASEVGLSRQRVHQIVTAQRHRLPHAEKTIPRYCQVCGNIVPASRFKFCSAECLAIHRKQADRSCLSVESKQRRRERAIAWRKAHPERAREIWRKADKKRRSKARQQPRSPLSQLD